MIENKKLPNLDVLIATSNEGKFDLVCRILSTVISYNLTLTKFFSLKDELSIVLPEEVGSIPERAKQKAEITRRLLGSKYTLYLGIDDGMKIPRMGVESPESKKIFKIITGKSFLEKGDEVIVMRTIFVINSRNGKSISIDSEIPFVYAGNSCVDNIPDKAFDPSGYLLYNPLGYILSIPGSEKLVVDEAVEVQLEYIKSKMPGLETINDIL